MPINEKALEAENKELNNFSDPTRSGEDTLRELLKLMNRISPTAPDSEFDTWLKAGFFGTQSGNFEEKKAVAVRIFQGTDIERIAKLDSKYRGKIFGKILNTGLFNLAFNAFPISEFGKERLYSVATARKGAADALDPARDTAWLTQLMQVVRNISADPITLGVINSYFPSLVTFCKNSSSFNRSLLSKFCMIPLRQSTRSPLSSFSFNITDFEASIKVSGCAACKAEALVNRISWFWFLSSMRFFSRSFEEGSLLNT